MENKPLRIITLNTWAGRALHPLMTFLDKYSADTDVFCLQEVHNCDQSVVDERHPDEHVYGKLFDKISGRLKDFEGSFARFDDDPHRMSLAMFWRRDLPLVKIEDFIVHRPSQPHERGSAVLSPRKLQYMTIDCGDEELLLAHYHGLWVNGPKTDTPERLTQSRELKNFLDAYKGKKILCGDFNLLPETESMKILEQGMQNLVKDYHVPSTRTVLYRHYENPAEPNFADYIFVSPDVHVKDFSVLPDIASDHAVLCLKINMKQEGEEDRQKKSKDNSIRTVQ